MIDKLENWLAAQKENLILWFPVFLGTGAAIYFGLKFEPSLAAILILWAISGLLLGAVYFTRHQPWSKFLFFFAALALFLGMTGFALSKIRTNFVYTPLILKETRPVMVEGNVAHTETLEGRKGSLIILDQVKIENRAPEQTPAQVRLTSKMHADINPGDRVQILAKLTPLSMPVIPDAYDFRRHYFFDSIGAMGFVLKKPVIIETAQTSQYGLFLERVRKAMGEHIKQVLPSRLAGIVTALVTGERAAIEDDDWNALRISGLAHVISISGLHVVLIAAPIFFFVRLFLAAIPSFAVLSNQEICCRGGFAGLFLLCGPCGTDCSDLSRTFNDRDRPDCHYAGPFAIVAASYFFRSNCRSFDCAGKHLVGELSALFRGSYIAYPVCRMDAKILVEMA